MMTGYYLRCDISLLNEVGDTVASITRTSKIQSSDEIGNKIAEVGAVFDVCARSKLPIPVREHIAEAAPPESCEEAHTDAESTVG